MKDRFVSDNDVLICFILLGIFVDEVDNYYSGVVVNYIYEMVVYILVWLNGKCYIGIIFSYYGVYCYGVDVEIILSLLCEDEEVIGDYFIFGLCYVIVIISGWKSCEGDNGM